MTEAADRSAEADPGPAIDPAKKFVRIHEVRADGFVSFDFAIGEPGLFVEMLLMRPDFEIFLRDQGPVMLSDGNAPAWTLRDAAKTASAGIDRGAFTCREFS